MKQILKQLGHDIDIRGKRGVVVDTVDVTIRGERKWSDVRDMRVLRERPV
jgi:hypothetical protein